MSEKQNITKMGRKKKKAEGRESFLEERK